MSTSNEKWELIPSSESSLSTIIKAEIDTKIATAKAFPRSLKEFRDKALSMATFSEEVASSCGYAVPRSGKSIEGPSVRLAEIITASYGNIIAGARVISNDGKRITAQGMCHDLETNNSVSVEITKSILQHEWKDGKKTGRMVTMTEDMQTVTGNAACAVAYRNAVFKVVPFALIEDIYEQTKEVAKGKAETLVARRDKAIAYFKSLNVTEAQLCEALEIKKVEDIDLDKLYTLNGFRSSIKNGEATVKSLFEKPVKEDSEKQQAILDKVSACKTIAELVKLHNTLDAKIQTAKWYEDASNAKEVELKKA